MAGNNRGHEALRLAFWISIVALVAAVPPIWPYGFYVFLRLGITAVSVVGIVVLWRSRAPDLVGLAVVALLFNPFVPVHLPKLAWVPIDLGVAVCFWSVIRRRLGNGLRAA